MVQYRGRLMPLVPFEPGFGLPSEGRKPVLVFADGERTMGLIVDEIVDIVEQHMKVELSTGAPGIMGSAIIAGKATDVIDAAYYLTQAHHDWFGARGEALEEKAQERILLVDDSPFFRNMLTPLLSVAGYEVTTAESADQALALHDSGAEFDVIVSDIELPGMSGFELAQAVRGTSRWKEVPIVALSSHSTPRDVERGRSAGFTDYVAKLDRNALLGALTQSLANLKGAA
jgi:two-component system chemotaxis sensor kinase CheA